MPVVIEIKNSAKLKRARAILGAKSNVETLELALDRVVESEEPKLTKPKKNDLPESFWDDLFSQRPILPAGSTSQAIIDERNEDRS